MTKFVKHLSKKEQEELFIEFAQAFATLKDPVEIAHFIKDLLSEAETIMLARRLQIAKLLFDGLTYDKIKENLKVGFSTIAKIHTWLQLYGEGYRTVLKRLKKKSEPTQPSSWQKVKRKYPMYFWPELLLEEIIKSANKKQREKLTNVLKQLKEKTGLAKELEQLLKRE